MSKQAHRKSTFFFGSVGICSFLISGSGCLAQSSKSVRPHIILIVADDLGWNDVSFHGANEIPTPNIDALAYNGVILNKHYVLPSCSPSRTSLLTGRYAIREGLQGWPLTTGEARAMPLDNILLPEYMRNLGYTTRLVGKWHVGCVTEDYTPARRGFDTFFGYYLGFISYFGSSNTRNLPNGTLVTGHDLHDDGPESLGVAYNDSVYFTDLVTAEAEQIIKSNGNEKPLFLEVAHLAVHAGDLAVPLAVRDETENDKMFSYIKDNDRRKYAGMVKALDESVGRIVTALSEAKMLENSIIVFVSDNGSPTVGLFNNTGSNYPFRGIKQYMFEGGVRGAACVFSPLIKASSRVSEKLIHIVDWLPTLYAAAGGNVDAIEKIDGVNQWETITQNSPAQRSSLLVNIDETVRNEAAIIGRYKLLKGAYEYDGFYGTTGNDPSYPAYKVQDVLSSPVSVAISRLTGIDQLSSSEVKELREKSTVNCGRITNYADCSSLCLIDLQNDPCETIDLSQQKPTIVKALEGFIERYRKVLVPQDKKPIDLCSLPQYFDGNWMPWRTNDNLSATFPDGTCDHPKYNFSGLLS